MQTTTTTLASLIDGALFELEAPSERGRPLVLSSNFLETTADTEFSLTVGDLSVSDLAEFGQELVLVTAKTADVVPVYTVARGYYGTTAAVHAAGAVGYANPQFARRRVAEAIQRSLTVIEAAGVQLVTSVAYTRVPGKRQLLLPANTRRVLQVLYVNSTSGRVLELADWFEYVVPTGNILMLPTYVVDSDSLVITATVPYEWTGTFPSEAATVLLPVGAEDLPSAYAAAWLTTGREVSRQELDRAAEWSQSVPTQSGSGIGLVRAKWQEFYRSLDEARRVTAFEVPRSRPLVKRPKVRI